MSYESWKKEFYPIDAEQAAAYYEGHDDWLVEHCLQKWTGALPKNTEKHDIEYRGHQIMDDEDYCCLVLASTSCSLCRAYADDEFACPRCPIVGCTGWTCDGSTYDEEKSEISHSDDRNVWSDSGADPQPMIDLLTKVLKWTKS